MAYKRLWLCPLCKTRTRLMRKHSKRVHKSSVYASRQGFFMVYHGDLLEIKVAEWPDSRAPEIVEVRS